MFTLSRHYRFMNHSRDGNVVARVVTRSDHDESEAETIIWEDGQFEQVVKPEGGWCDCKRVEFYSRANIVAGEELLFNYGEAFGNFLDSSR